jgi:hypothetical protein
MATVGNKVSKEADIPSTITLYNGARVSAGEAIVIMGRLERLLKRGSHGRILLRGLSGICREDCPGESVAVHTLIAAGLLEENGLPSDCVKNVVLSSVVIKDRDDVELRQPYPDSPENVAVMSRSVTRIVESLGLADLLEGPGGSGESRTR